MGSLGFVELGIEPLVLQARPEVLAKDCNVLLIRRLVWCDERDVVLDEYGVEGEQVLDVYFCVVGLDLNLRIRQPLLEDGLVSEAAGEEVLYFRVHVFRVDQGLGLRYLRRGDEGAPLVFERVLKMVFQLDLEPYQRICRHANSELRCGVLRFYLLDGTPVISTPMTEEQFANIRKRIVNEQRHITGDISGNIRGKNKSHIMFRLKRNNKFPNSPPIYRRR